MYKNHNQTGVFTICHLSTFKTIILILAFPVYMLVKFEPVNCIMRAKLFFGIAAVLFSNTVFAQSDDSSVIKKIIDDVLVNSPAYENLRYICKKIGPRLSGSANAQKAVEATVKMLKEAGADTVYLQPCMVPHWIRGAKETGYIQLAGGKKMSLHLTALGNSVGTGKKGISAGVVEIKSMEELNAAGEKMLKGKIVFLNFMMRPTNINVFKSYAESGIARWGAPTIAAKYGAVAAMVRSMAINNDDYPHTGVTVYKDSFPKIPAVAICTNDAEWLSRQLQIKMQLTAYIQTSCQMLPDAPSFNVVGEIRGSEYPGEIITVGGHLDSWDLAEGAQDDGAGCVQSIEVLRAIRANNIKPKHTIRAVMFMNEENGNRGGKKYLEIAEANKEKHLFALESDEGGFTPRGFNFTATETQFEKIRPWQKLLVNSGIDYFGTNGGGADIDPLKKLHTVVADLAPDTQRYFDIHHAATDVFENVSRRELLLGAANMAALIYLVDKYGL
jgi:carboxypeptidase Q